MTLHALPLASFFLLVTFSGLTSPVDSLHLRSIKWHNSHIAGAEGEESVQCQVVISSPSHAPHHSAISLHSLDTLIASRIWSC